MEIKLCEFRSKRRIYGGNEWKESLPSEIEIAADRERARVFLCPMLGKIKVSESKEGEMIIKVWIGFGFLADGFFERGKATRRPADQQKEIK